MSRVDVSIVTVWESIRSLLRDGLELSDDTCFWWIDNGDPPPPSADTNLFLTLTPDGGTFDPGMLQGGGVHQVTVSHTLVVTVHCTNRLDAGGRSDYFLTSESGMGQMMARVIAILTDADPTTDETTGNTFVRELIRPIGFSKPERIAEDRYGSVAIHFEVGFDWDVS